MVSIDKLQGSPRPTWVLKEPIIGPLKFKMVDMSLVLQICARAYSIAEAIFFNWGQPSPHE